MTREEALTMLLLLADDFEAVMVTMTGIQTHLQECREAFEVPIVATPTKVKQFRGAGASFEAAITGALLAHGRSMRTAEVVRALGATSDKAISGITSGLVNCHKNPLINIKRVVWGVYDLIDRPKASEQSAANGLYA